MPIKAAPGRCGNSARYSQGKRPSGSVPPFLTWAGPEKECGGMIGQPRGIGLKVEVHRCQCTIKGDRDVDAMELAKACEELGGGEIFLNCIDKDGTNSGIAVTAFQVLTLAQKFCF
ncbi:MAG: hypothetical protein D9V46_07055 [Deltaproteobacteria bacterium]|nr:MAG: hypothetical protein D9V46_07055 [Deltaproteobacteria bacterium]